MNELTPNQRVRREQLERLAFDVTQLSAFAKELGIPTRFLKSFEQLKTYIEQQNAQLGRDRA